MRRAAVLLVMMFARLWQSVALPPIGSKMNLLADLQHAAPHWQQHSHHHHGDGSYHLDESNESAQHLATVHLNATRAMAAMSLPQYAAAGSGAYGGVRETRALIPTLDGLLRPPRLRS